MKENKSKSKSKPEQEKEIGNRCNTMATPPQSDLTGCCVPSTAEMGRLLQTQSDLAAFVDEWKVLTPTGTGEYGQCTINAKDADEDRRVVGFYLFFDTIHGYALRSHVWNVDQGGKWYDTTPAAYGNKTCLVTTKNPTVNRILAQWAKMTEPTILIREICKDKNEMQSLIVDQYAGIHVTIAEVVANPYCLQHTQIHLNVQGPRQPNYQIGLDMVVYENIVTQRHPRVRLAKLFMEKFPSLASRSMVELSQFVYIQNLV